MEAKTMNMVLLYGLFISLLASLTHAGDGIYARDGKGDPVSWWVVYKLPMLSRSGGANSSLIQPTPCDCPPPNCSQLPTETLNVTVRATGLCYLYADSNNATLRHFRELGYECLGQGGDDPLSHTLRHIQPRNTTNASTEAKYWAIFNDQLNGIAESFQPPQNGRENGQNGPNAAKRVCSGSDLFSAHAKGAVAFDGTSGGVYLQTTTPNFPDPSPVDSSRGDKFIPLGCQKDNNVQFAQHMMGLSMDMTSLNALGSHLQAARLCSGNFYQDLHDVMASASFKQDGLKPETNANFSGMFKALYDAALPGIEASSTFEVQLRDVHEKPKARSKVFEPLSELEASLAMKMSKLEGGRQRATNITVTVKSPQATVPPWALLAEAIQSDMSVASWWDGGFGIPNICAGDVYTNATNRFCIDDATHGVPLNANGTAKFNVENLIEASWLLPNATEKLRWHLVGGSRQDGNHAKWGVSTPRYGLPVQRHLVVFADLNMEGFPCSTSCHGSQAGRGGSFFAFDDPALHSSFTESLIAKACPCTAPPEATDPPTDQSYETLRMCRMGCWRKVQQHFQPEELPVMSSDATSFWKSSP